MKPTATKARGKGIFRIVEFTNPSGDTAFRVSGWTMDGDRIRQNYKAHGEAVNRKQELEVQAANLESAGQTVFTRLTPEEVQDAESALSALRAAGHTSTSLRVGIDFFIRNWRDPLKRILTSVAVETFMSEKKAANRRKRHLESLKQDLDRLAENFGNKSVHELTKLDLLTLIEDQNRAPITRNHIRDRFHNFLGWCVKHGYAPVNCAALIEKKSVETGEISVLTNRQVCDLLAAATRFKKGKLVPYVALGTFCAIRPDELARLSWDKIDLKEKQLTITASAAKKRGRRVVDIPENCLAWLRPHAKKKTAIKGKNWRRDFEAIRAQIGFGTPVADDKSRKDLKPWPEDVLRHTGISCHYRVQNNEGLTASWAGNSPDMIHTHYRALVSAKDAKDFFEIMPKAKRRPAKRQAQVAKNIVLLPKVA